MKMKSPLAVAVSVALTDGTSIAVTPEGNDVPMRYFQAAVTAGCLPCEDEAGTQAKPQNNTEKTPAETLKALLITMVEADNDEDFREDGLPKLEVVIDKLGRNITETELVAAFNELQAEADTEAEMEALRAEARALKVSSPHRIKNIDTLKARIAEAKAGK